MEHGYLYDRQDLEAHPMGQRFLREHDMAPCELVETSNAYHSDASVIEGGPASRMLSPRNDCAGCVDGGHMLKAL